ncbi:MAG: methylmalonyl Co-A mutase-associated GTPase MeaB, partial [Clostridiales bacterium]|nr:methylmalonyl Co-A mutase-associated GTPase MeaB [Clostridiales bacterium]
MLGGDKRALARLITLVENGGPLGEKVLSAVFARRGRPRIVGVTGPPGSGKSSLVDLLVKELRGEGQTVGVVAVDPNSPFSGGAILGDRIRMQKHFLDSGVFIRSMSSRGSLGGLASATKEVVGLMEAFAFDVIIVETVGVGQSELDIMHVADSTVLLVPPESGDGIQVIKAGVMEIADIFAVNKSDLPGAASAIDQLEA